jgi:ubiquinone/menaquinone biosynthesis C-methylase UbiE
MEPVKSRPVWIDPDAYEIYMGRWSERLAKPFLAIADIAPGSRVLDVACGTGVSTKALAEAGAHVIGMDASEGYLEGARHHRSHPNIAYEVGDIRQMRFDDGSFDATVSTLALDVLSEIEQVVAEMMRVTRPRGVVASGVQLGKIKADRGNLHGRRSLSLWRSSVTTTLWHIDAVEQGASTPSH